MTNLSSFSESMSNQQIYYKQAQIKSGPILKIAGNKWFRYTMLAGTWPLQNGMDQSKGIVRKRICACLEVLSDTVIVPPEPAHHKYETDILKDGMKTCDRTEPPIIQLYEIQLHECGEEV